MGGKSDDEGGGYATSPIRFVILGVLVVTMLVLGYFLYRKFTAEDPEEVHRREMLRPVGPGK